jgi:hypothetical protein
LRTEEVIGCLLYLLEAAEEGVEEGEEEEGEQEVEQEEVAVVVFQPLEVLVEVLILRVNLVDRVFKLEGLVRALVLAAASHIMIAGLHLNVEDEVA